MWRIFMEFILRLSDTSSRAAKRRGDPASLDLPLAGHEGYRGDITASSLMLLAKTGYAKVSHGRGHVKVVEKFPRSAIRISLCPSVGCKNFLQESYFKLSSI